MKRYRVADCGLCPIIVPPFRIVHMRTLALVDDTDGATLAQFIGAAEISRPYAERIAQLLNTYGAVDDAELTAIADEGTAT